MGWKNWPSWLKGGTILAGIYTILALLLLVAIPDTLFGEDVNVLEPNSKIDAQIVFTILFIILSIAGATVLNILNFNSEASFSAFLIIYLTSVMTYFLIGALIGYIIGKIKSKKQPQQLN